ncbi:MSCRAMM family protein [Streptomyces virginiae]
MKHRPLLFTALALTTAAVLTGPAATATAAPSSSAEAPKAHGDPAPADKAGLRIVKTDPEGQPAPGAAFQLLDSEGKTLADGKTDSEGTLAFSDLTPGVVRLKETASGSPLLGTVPDQDVVVAPVTPRAWRSPTRTSPPASPSRSPTRPQARAWPEPSSTSPRRTPRTTRAPLHPHHRPGRHRQGPAPRRQEDRQRLHRHRDQGPGRLPAGDHPG